MGEDTTRKPKWTELSKEHANLCVSSICKIAAAANVELSKATMAVYVERMDRLSSERIRQATTRTIEDWAEPSKMPPLSFILERSYLQVIPEVRDDAPRILNRPQLTGEVETHETRQAFSARLIAEMQAKLKTANAMPPAEMPRNPEARKTWATATAKKQGWL